MAGYTFSFGKWLYVILIIILAPHLSFAGDDPCVPTFIASNNTSFTSIDNSGNTSSSVMAPPLGGYIGPDTWISFTMTNSDLYLLLQAESMVNPAIAIYSGDCNELTLLYNVVDNNCNGDVAPELILDELTPGEDYLIRVYPENGTSNGSFGIFLGTSFPQLPNFTAFADASINGDCIDLTSPNNSQHGCAWYQIQIDFSMPFTHSMTANFGNKDINGADGICLVYQSNGPDYCGISGGGIGAQGMPNSAIFEFDTYQNGAPQNDPVQDHASFNINGNMNHPSSINGPVSLGNIEDNLDHDITFSWNPAGNLYELFFDGVLILSGSFDIINNCFGGNNLAYWGYTASTGALNNHHVICPEVVDYDLSTVSYESITICENESYNGWTSSGFYISYLPGSNGCIHQTHTELTVLTDSDPFYFEKYICEGELFSVEGSTFNEGGYYEIHTNSVDGCDSTILLDLYVIESSVEIDGVTALDCNNDNTLLSTIINANYPIQDINYSWSTPTGNSNSDIYWATEFGTYTVTAFLTFDDILCIVDHSIIINSDFIQPNITELDDLNIDCSTADSLKILHHNFDENNVVYEWYQGNIFLSDQDTLQINSPGTYTLLATNIENGCTSMKDAQVFIDGSFPEVDLDTNYYVFNCAFSSTDISPLLSSDVTDVNWNYNGNTISTIPDITISESGIYEISVFNAAGCSTQKSITVVHDTLAPTIEVLDYIIPCDEAYIDVNTSVVDYTNINFSGPSFVSITDSTLRISESGYYVIEATNSANKCSITDSFYVEKLGNSPELTIIGNNINCTDTVSYISLISTDTNIVYQWNINSIEISQEQSIEVTQGGTYYVEALTNTACYSIDSIIISENHIYPDIILSADTIDCDNTSTTINAQVSNGTIIEWQYNMQNIIGENMLMVEEPGLYFIEVVNDETGCISTDSINIIDNSNPPDFTFENNNIDCNNASTVLNLSLISDYESVTWTYPDNSINNSIAPTTSLAGAYGLHIEVEGSCDFDTTILVTIDTLSPTLNLDYGVIDCTTPSTFINIIDYNNSYQYNIQSESGDEFNNATNITSQSGLYIAETEAANGCKTTATFTIPNYISTPTASINGNQLLICAIPTSTLEASSELINLNYTWYDSNNQLIGFSETITTETAGTYYLSINDIHGCSNQYEITIEEDKIAPEIELEGNNIDCIILSSDLNFTTNENLTNIIWSFGNQQIASDPTINITQQGWYHLSITDEQGCQSEDSIYISVDQSIPNIELITMDTITIITGVEEAIIVESFDNLSNIIWMPEDGLSCVDCLSPYINTYSTDEYQLTVTSENGCSNTLSVYTRAQRLPVVNIPNIFSPSQLDGNNDHFTLYGNENIAIINEVVIYDRWGSLVYTNSNYLPNVPSLGWDGSYKGDKVINGVYVYIFKVTTVDGETLIFSGDVTVI